MFLATGTYIWCSGHQLSSVFRQLPSIESIIATSNASIYAGYILAAFGSVSKQFLLPYISRHCCCKAECQSTVEQTRDRGDSRKEETTSRDMDTNIMTRVANTMKQL